MKPRSVKRGARISAPEVTGISRLGVSLLLDGRERLLDFEFFPWFREAPVRAVFNVSRPSVGHLYWADLDVDIELDTLEHPERYPLVSRLLPATLRETPRRARPGSSGGRAAAPVKAKRPASRRPR